MARRNIFDRDTGAGYYSDALGNFLENIPSFYGQIAKEKRLERQRIEDVNYRNQTYNNQLLQQSRNNIRQKKLDDLNERKFNQKVNNDNYTQAYQIAKAKYDATGDYSQLAQVEQRYSPETYDSEKVNKIKAGTTDRQIFDANYLDWDSLSLDEKYGRGNELQDLISESSRLMKTGDARNKINYQNINKILRNEFKTYTKNSGQLIKDKDLWSGQKGQIGLQAYNSNERGIESAEKQIDALKSKVNEIIPRNNAIKNPTTLKELGYNDMQIKEINTLNRRIENLKNEKVNLTSGNVTIANDFRYPIFNIDPTGEDYALEGMKSERPVEQETNITENNQEKLEEIDADILASVGDLDDVKIDEFMSALESDNPEDLNNYLFGFEEGGDDLPEGEPAPKPIQTDLAGVETGDDLPEGEPTIPDPIPDPKPDPPTGGTVLPTATASPVQEFIENIEKESELPKVPDLGSVTKPISAEEFENLDMKDAEGKRVSLSDNVGVFNKKITNMIKRVKDLEKIQKQSGYSNLQRQQLRLEQEQLVRDLYAISDGVLSLGDSFISSKGSNKSVGYKQSVKKITGQIPFSLRRN